MKKCYIAIILLVSIVLCGCSMNTKREKSKFYWIPEESYFVDYEIVDNNIVFSYSICFVNDWDEDYAVDISAKFKKSELRNWIEYKGFYLATSTDNVIKANSKKNIIYCFEGKYLGGKVNTDISFPTEIILSTYLPLS